MDFQHRPLDRTYDFYGLQSYLQTLLYAPQEAKARELKSALYYKDAAGAMDVIPAARADNPGAYERMAIASQNTAITMQGKLMVDSFNVARPLVEGVSVTLQLIPAPPEKYLLAAPDQVGGAIPEYGVRIDDCFLLVPRLKVKPNLLKQVASYPWIKQETLKFIHPAGVLNFNAKEIYTGGSIPRRAFVVMIKEDYLNGDIQHNWLNLEHFGAVQMLMEVNGSHRPYVNGYKMNFATFDYTEVYNGLFYELNKQTDQGSIDITHEEFRGGFTVFAFDLSDNKVCPSDAYAESKPGRVKLSFRLSAGIQHNIAVLVVLEHERIIRIDRARNWTDRPAYGN